MAKVKFATDWTSADGKAHKGGSTAEIDGHDARSLILRGIAQAVTTTAFDDPKPATPKEK